MRLDPKPVLVLIDKSEHFFNWRSSSAWAKKADAVFRISLARRSSLTSRLSAFISSPLPVLSPFRRPSSMSAYLTQRRNGSVVQPIFSATEQVAAQRDECSCNACSNSRTARSLTSGEYRFVFMTPVSQLLESPGNPGRFSSVMITRRRLKRVKGWSPNKRHWWPLQTKNADRLNNNSPTRLCLPLAPNRGRNRCNNAVPI
jgi:hypothetical protein